jgi:hypothetical protein
MGNIEFKFESLDRWPYAGKGSKRATFKTNYNRTLAQLRAELSRAHARNPVIQSGHLGEDIRFDGLPRVNARKPRFPGVCLVFEKWAPIGRTNEAGQMLGRYSTLEFPCATYDHWEDNLRAIVLTLEALRAVARYGVSGTGAEGAGKTEEAKQYEGFARKKVEARTGTPPGNGTMTKEAAAAILAACARGGWTQASLMTASAAEVKSCYKRAARHEHPDAGGSDETFARINEAYRVLSNE